MAQFDIYRGRGQGIDYLLDLQDDLLEHLSTRIVAPLAAPENLGPEMKRVNPRIPIGGREHILLTHLLAAIPFKSLGESVGSARACRNDIIAALDFLFTGV